MDLHADHPGLRPIGFAFVAYLVVWVVSLALQPYTWGTLVPWVAFLLSPMGVVLALFLRPVVLAGVGLVTLAFMFVPTNAALFLQTLGVYWLLVAAVRLVHEGSAQRSASG